MAAQPERSGPCTTSTCRSRSGAKPGERVTGHRPDGGQAPATALTRAEESRTDGGNPGLQTFIGLATIRLHRRRHLVLGEDLLTAGPPATRQVAPLERTLELGIMAGMVAALVMGLFAMVVAATRGLGLYTPLYLVTAVVEPGSPTAWSSSAS